MPRCYRIVTWIETMAIESRDNIDTPITPMEAWLRRQKLFLIKKEFQDYKNIISRTYS